MPSKKRGGVRPLNQKKGLAIGDALERITGDSPDAILNTGESEATSSQNNDLFFFVEYIRSLKGEVENLPEVVEERDMEKLLAISHIPIKDNPRYPVSKYLLEMGSLLESELKNRSVILKKQESELRTQSGGIAPTGYLEKKIRLTGNDINLEDIAQGKIYENDDFIKYMNEILIASIIDSCRCSHIEYHPCSDKNMILTHPSTTVSRNATYRFSDVIPKEQFRGFASALDRSENEILEEFLTDWMNCIKSKLERWRSRSGKVSGVFRTSIPITIQTYFYNAEIRRRSTRDHKRIHEEGHQILLCYEENTNQEKKFYIIDQLEYGLHHTFNIHDFIFQAFVYVGYPRAMGEDVFAPGVNLERRDVDEKFWRGRGQFKVIRNEMDGEEDIFTCVSRATRAAIMLAFIEKPESILEKPVDDLKRLEFKYFNKIARYHLVKMASWILSNDLIVRNHWRVTGPYNNHYVHEISGPEKAYIVLHDISKVIHASGPKEQDHPVKYYSFCLESPSILGTFKEKTREEIINPKSGAASSKVRKSAPSSCAVSKEFPFNTLNPHFVIQ